VTRDKTVNILQQLKNTLGKRCLLHYYLEHGSSLIIWKKVRSHTKVIHASIGSENSATRHLVCKGLTERNMKILTSVNFLSKAGHLPTAVNELLYISCWYHTKVPSNEFYKRNWEDNEARVPKLQSKCPDMITLLITWSVNSLLSLNHSNLQTARPHLWDGTDSLHICTVAGNMIG
jgi:hypothetical protein